ncbi:hypothetical protein ACLOJK_001204 [Asimina triloba]
MECVCSGRVSTLGCSRQIFSLRESDTDPFSGWTHMHRWQRLLAGQRAWDENLPHARVGRVVSLHTRGGGAGETVRPTSPRPSPSLVPGQPCSLAGPATHLLPDARAGATRRTCPQLIL